eukprot:Skav235198  [mRNA]  locus=scaffold5470:27077:28042:+ [translate_table: standard]
MDIEKKKGVKLGNEICISTLAQDAGGRLLAEVVATYSVVTASRSELEQQFIASGAFQHALRRTDIDGFELNVKPKKNYKGTLDILINEKKVRFHFTQAHSFGDVANALHEAFGIDCGSDGVFKLKHCDTASYLYDYEPVFASFSGQAYRVELVVSMRGGVKPTAVKKKMEKTEMLKKKVQEKAAVVNEHPIAEVALVEQMLGKVVADAEKSGSDAIDGLIALMNIQSIEEILTYLDEHVAHSMDTKIRAISCKVFGEHMEKIVKASETFDHLKESCAVILNFAFAKASTEKQGYNMKSFRVVLEKHLNQKIGSRDANDMNL